MGQIDISGLMDTDTFRVTGPRDFRFGNGRPKMVVARHSVLRGRCAYMALWNSSDEYFNVSLPNATLVYIWPVRTFSRVHLYLCPAVHPPFSLGGSFQIFKRQYSCSCAAYSTFSDKNWFKDFLQRKLISNYVLYYYFLYS